MPKRTVVLGVTGGIAAYKACEAASALKKLNYDVKVIMTQNAQEFVTPLTFETLTGNRVVTDMFAKDRGFDVEHVSLAKAADVFLVAPATANLIGKLAEGLADDMLTTTLMATRAPIVICPAMNTAMYESEACQKNMETLKARGYHFVEPNEGYLACGDVGKGRMAEPAEIVAFVDKMLTPNADLRGKTFLITAGATREPVDGVRYISNRSSGKMGVALAEAAVERGAEVLFVYGHMTVSAPARVKLFPVSTTEEMYERVMSHLPAADVIIKAAAPADYRVKHYSEQKIKSETLTLEFEKNPDIAAAVGKAKGDRTLVVFAAETEELVTNALAKLQKKNADMIIANDVTAPNAGFDVDTNVATVIEKNGMITGLEEMTKFALAHEILDRILAL